MENELQQILISLASSSNTISYDELLKALNINSIRHLEDFIIRAISQEVIKGRLNPREQKLEINDWSTQKVGNNFDLEAMYNTLNGWIQHCDSFVASLCEEVEHSKKRLIDENGREKRLELEVEKIRKILYNNGKFARNENQSENVTKTSKNEAKRYKGLSFRPKGSKN